MKADVSRLTGTFHVPELEQPVSLLWFAALQGNECSLTHFLSDFYYKKLVLAIKMKLHFNMGTHITFYETFYRIENNDQI